MLIRRRTDGPALKGQHSGRVESWLTYLREIAALVLM